MSDIKCIEIDMHSLLPLNAVADEFHIGLLDHIQNCFTLKYDYRSCYVLNLYILVGNKFHLPSYNVNHAQFEKFGCYVVVQALK